MSKINPHFVTILVSTTKRAAAVTLNVICNQNITWLSRIYSLAGDISNSKWFT